MPGTIVEQLLLNCRLHPEKKAVIHGTEAVSYSALSGKIHATIEYFKVLNLQKGAKIAFSAEASVLFPQIYFSIHAIGAVAIPIDVSLKNEQIQKILDIADPDICFLSKKQFFEDKRVYDLEKLTVLDDGKEIDFIFPEASDLADVIFTTGTTGEPKGVMLSHKNILAGAVNTILFIGNTASDIEIIPLPLHHAFGLRRLRTNLLLGATIVLIKGFMFPKQILGAIEDVGATGICMVPAGLSVIKRLAGDKMYSTFKKLHYIEFGSSSMKLEDKNELVNQLPNVKLCMHYGLTEAAANIFIEFNKDKVHLKALGKASPNIDIKIVDEQGSYLPDGEIGEIMVKGDVNTVGYLNRPDLTSEVKSNEWIKTKDLGYIDSDGYIFLTGRKDDVINVGGKKVFPQEIEAILSNHPFVSECVCVGTKEGDNLTGETIVAFIVLENNVEEPSKEELTGFLRGGLHEYKIPRKYIFLSNLPKTGSGKVMRSRLEF